MIWDNLASLDQHITLAINGLHCPASDAFWQFFTYKWTWIPLYAAVIFFAMKRLGWKKGLIMVAAVAATIGLGDSLMNVIKHSVCRPRPCNDDFMIAGGLNILEKITKSYSFPSAHAATAFSFAACSTILFKTEKNHRYNLYGWLIFIWAALYGISRVFVGKHYFGDVMAGAIIGAALGLVIASLAGFIIGKVWPSPSESL